MASQIKDHYRALEIPPAATQEEIKKAFRKLAFRYHPDTNPDSRYMTARFNEVQEAYLILSNKEKRSRYDEERWLAGLGNRSREQVRITPEWLQKEAQKLNKHMAIIDTYRMSHSALQQYINLLLSDQHLAVLETESTEDINNDIARTLLLATTKLKHAYMAQAGMRLKKIPHIHTEIVNDIDKQIKQSKSSQKRVDLFPLAIVLIAIILAAIMYLWART